MNNGRIWCVVSPTVGLPLFLGSVAAISFTVHFAVLNNTTWVKDFFQGKKAKTAALETEVSPLAAQRTANAAGFSVNVTPVAAGTGTGGTAFVVTVTPTEQVLARTASSNVALAAPPSR